MNGSEVRKTGNGNRVQLFLNIQVNNSVIDFKLYGNVFCCSDKHVWYYMFAKVYYKKPYAFCIVYWTCRMIERNELNDSYLLINIYLIYTNVHCFNKSIDKQKYEYI